MFRWTVSILLFFLTVALASATVDAEICSYGEYRSRTERLPDFIPLDEGTSLPTLLSERTGCEFVSITLRDRAQEIGDTLRKTREATDSIENSIEALQLRPAGVQEAVNEVWGVQFGTLANDELERYLKETYMAVESLQGLEDEVTTITENEMRDLGYEVATLGGELEVATAMVEAARRWGTLYQVRWTNALEGEVMTGSGGAQWQAHLEQTGQTLNQIGWVETMI
jgi:hypothetical protein